MCIAAIYSSCCYKNGESEGRCLSNSLISLFYFNALIMEEAHAGLLSLVVCNIVLLCCYTAFFFIGFSSEWEMFVQSINRLSGDKRSQADGIIP